MQPTGYVNLVVTQITVSEACITMTWVAKLGERLARRSGSLAQRAGWVTHDVELLQGVEVVKASTMVSADRELKPEPS